MKNEESIRMKEELKIGSKWYFDLYDLAPIGYLTLNESGLILEANLTTATMLGETREALENQNISKFILKADIETYDLNRKKICLSSPPQTCSLRFLKSDGDLIFVHLSAKAMCHEGEILYRVILSDITEQNKVDVLQLNMEAYRKLVHDLPVGVILQGSKTEIISANVRALTLLGLTESQLIGKTCFDENWNAIHEDGSPFPGFMFPVTQAIATGKSVLNTVMGIYRTACKDRIWLLVNAVLQLNPDKSLHMVVCTLDDITERVNHEFNHMSQSIYIEELSNRLVQSQEQARRRFSRELHDRTSPNLAALKINLDIIMRATSGARALQSYSDRIEDTQALIEDTTMSVRDICAELHPPLLDSKGLIDVLQSYALQFSKRTGLLVSVQCPHGEVRLAANVELALFRIVQEAMTNSAKHANATSVVVRLQLDSVPMLLSIKDDGTGFDLNQADALGSARGQGLLNMKETVEFIGGRFRLESVPGSGTRVYVDI